jgi:hypothetical protein
MDFAILDYTNSVVFEDDDVAIAGLSHGRRQGPEAAGTTFVAVAAGALWVNERRLDAGMYACAPEPAAFEGSPDCRALLATAKRYHGLFSLGGPIENSGRLRYIDGCSDTGLIQPLKLGDPCLNYLHFPGKTRQTPHYHPSHRVGLVYAGEGLCHTGAQTTPMRPGDMWFIPAGLEHWFETDEATLRVIAFHPDSEFGPTDESHQMLNATVTTAAAA